MIISFYSGAFNLYKVIIDSFYFDYFFSVKMLMLLVINYEIFDVPAELLQNLMTSMMTCNCVMCQSV